MTFIMVYKRIKNSFLKYYILLLILLTGCQTFPSGEQLSEVQKDYLFPASSGLSTTDVYRYYAICRAAWREYDSWMESGWDLNYFHNKETDTLGLFILDDDILYISFRSSRALKQNSTDLSNNMKVGLKSIPFIPDTGIKVHSGFLEKYMSIRDIILKKKIETNPKKIILTGHSLGGALGSIAYIDLKHLDPYIPLMGVTFGMARAFNSKGAEWYKSQEDNFIRVVNGRDIIPNLPPILFGYRHVGRLVRIGDRPVWKIYSAYDHHPGYQKSLESILRQEGIDPDSLGF